MRNLNARSCEVRQIGAEQAHAFLLLHHRQGATGQGSTTDLGLFFEEELVGLVQFCYPRTRAKQRLYTTELLRLCFKTGVRVRGGASKLIEHYRRTRRPADFFTYQDTGGEAGQVYAQAGMTLVTKARPKTYLVAPGKTLETAERREYWSIAEASRRGPDALLGTSLGEVFHREGPKKGKRKTNPELFIEELGWHEEVAAGDNVWEWRSPTASYYTYRITATDSDKYYYGVKSTVGELSREAAEQDGYWGSGGMKFQNWKKHHEETLEKSVLNFYDSKVEALEAEEALIGDRFKTDPLCLNSMPGGAGHYVAPALYLVRRCPVHGEVKHLGDKCLTCRANDSIQTKLCPIHGETKHQGSLCRKCLNASLVSMAACPTHGQTRHIGEKCFRCRTVNLSMGDCSVHGRTELRDGRCWRCVTTGGFSAGTCPLHGEVKMRGGKCAACLRSSSISEKNCSTHGLVKHDGDVCAFCRAEATVTIQACPIHGQVKHQGSTCSTCAVERTLNERECPTHGLTLHSGSACRRCISERAISEKHCAIHGLTPHNGDRCAKCQADAVYSAKVCAVHGEAKHQGSRCLLCLADSKKSLQSCERHGEQEFYNNACPKCKGERIRHTRSHVKKNAPDPTCIHCV